MGYNRKITVCGKRYCLNIKMFSGDLGTDQYNINHLLMVFIEPCCKPKPNQTNTLSD